MTQSGSGEPRFSDPRDRLFYSPIHRRPKIVWPHGARVAFWISPNVEHYEYLPPASETFTLFSRVPVPDVQQYGVRDYGNRAAFQRFADALDEFGLRATVSLNAAVLIHYPEIAQAMMSRNWEFMGHGVYNTRSVFDLSEQEEYEQLRTMRDIIQDVSGKSLKGVLGPALSSNLWTADVVADLGLIYHADWIHDDQPTPIRVRNGRLISMPYSYELNDLNPANADMEALAASWQAQFDCLWREGAESGRVMHLALHPYVAAQPHAIGYLKSFLKGLVQREHVWLATGGEIAQHYLDHCYEAEVAFATALAEEKAR